VDNLCKAVCILDAALNWCLKSTKYVYDIKVKSESIKHGDQNSTGMGPGQVQ
jgi:hypothetical protein